MLSNALIIWGSRILLLVPQVLLVPFLIQTVGEAGYGAYALVCSLFGSLEQLQRSLQSGVVKYSAGFLAQGRMDEVNQVVSSSFVYSILLAVLMSVGFLIAAALSRDFSNQMGFALAVAASTIGLVVPLTPYVAVIQSRQCYYVDALIKMVSQYGSLIAIVFWFRAAGPSVRALIGIVAGTLLLFRLPQVAIAHHMVPGLHVRIRLCRCSHFWSVASFGAVTVVASLCLAANSAGIRWLMGYLVSTSFVAHFAIILMPMLLLSDITGAITVTVMPATSAYVATGNWTMLHELLARGMRYTTSLGLAGFLIACFLMKPVLILWVGSEYAFLAPYALVLFASGAFMQSTLIGHHMLKGLGRLRAVAFIYGFGLVIVPAGVILTVLWIWHAPYMAVTTGLAAGHLVCGWLQIAFVAKVVHADYRKLLVFAYVQPLLAAGAAWLMTWGVIVCIAGDGLAGRICVSVLAVLLFFVAAYYLISTESERRQLKEAIRYVLRRIVTV